MRVLVALLTVLCGLGCGGTRAAPSPTAVAITGTSIIVGEEAHASCIVTTLPRAERDYNQLAGWIGPGAQIDVATQWGVTVHWTGQEIDPSLSLTEHTMKDPYAGPCQMTEHVISDVLTLTFHTGEWTGTQVTRYALQADDGRVVYTITDTSAVVLKRR
jgi:hypothetical protein